MTTHERHEWHAGTPHTPARQASAGSVSNVRPRIRVQELQAVLHAVLRLLVDIYCAECGVQGRSDERRQPTRGGGGEAASRLQQGLRRGVRW